MGQAHRPTPVKLMVSLLSGHSELFGLAERALAERFGPIDYAGPLLPFAHTDYYAAEFGTDLLRRIVTLEELIDPGILADVKTWTNALEWQLAEGERRRINLDPGYLSAGKLVLATTKNHAHRVYLRDGIYAEVTLSYQRKAWHAWPWTYPDYGSAPYLEMMTALRARYMAQLRAIPQAGAQPPVATPGA
jgi:hypothetical protein